MRMGRSLQGCSQLPSRPSPENSEVGNRDESELLQLLSRQRIPCGVRDIEVLTGGWALGTQRKLYPVPSRVKSSSLFCRLPSSGEGQFYSQIKAQSLAPAYAYVEIQPAVTEMITQDSARDLYSSSLPELQVLTLGVTTQFFQGRLWTFLVQ